MRCPAVARTTVARMDTTAWQPPPRDVLGHPVTVQQFVARSEHAVVALQHAVAFPQGCALSLLLAVRRGALGDAAWEGVLESQLGLTPDPVAAEDGLRFGIRLPDGVPGPRLGEMERGASSDDHEYRGDLRLWLSPLPPPLPFEFHVEWRGTGLDLTSTTLDGAALARSARDARPLWDRSL